MREETINLCNTTVPFQSFTVLPELEEEKKEIDRYKISRIENDITQIKLKLNQILKIVNEIRDSIKKE